ncbi:MAG: tetratricopeptide repeat protein, partial [Gammaproteobacteria bacterium]
AILEQVPEQFDALHFSGVLALQQGRSTEAADLIGRAVARRPGHVDARCNLGSALRAAGRLEEATSVLRALVAEQPDLVQAHNNLGNVLQDLGRAGEAVDCYRRALRLAPDFVDARSNLGRACGAIGRHAEAVEHCRAALALQPGHVDALHHLGNALLALRDWEGAERAFAGALGAGPPGGEAAYGRGVALEQTGRWPEAAAAYREALATIDNPGPVLSNLLYLSKRMCDWPAVAELGQRFREALRAGKTGLTPFVFLAEETTPAEQLDCARRWAAQVADDVRGIDLPARHPRSDDAKIHVGYLSADFHEHATAWLAAGLFEAHDRERFRVSAYSLGPDDGSAMRRRLEAGFDAFVDLRGMTPVEMATRIRADGVDILVDLKGYTADAASEVPALRPAPVQVNYLGYPGTMGADFIDYILVDDFVAPADRAADFSESLVHLPGCYQVNDRRRSLPGRPPSRRECGLPESGMVYCCFNSSYKISASVFETWMKLLKCVPDSVLWLLDAAPAARLPERLRKAASQHGVDPNRLIFMPRLPQADYLARYLHADLFLDTWPYNAHTTASDSLWAGTPLLTLAGETFASRVGGSLLRAVGLEELITRSVDDYLDRAAQLAADPGRRAALRDHLIASREQAPAFDTLAFTRAVEAAFLRMHERACAGLAPESFTVESK